MATISFFAGQSPISNLSGSGLGFFGSSGFGASVAVAAFQDKTYITNGAGTSQGPEAWNTKYLNSASGYLAGATSGIALTCFTNYQAPVQIHFRHDTSVTVQNAKLRIYDRSNPDNNPSGVTCAVAEIIHPGTTQANSGSGDTTWQYPVGSSVILSLANSPNVSGTLAGNGSQGVAGIDHDWYVAISASPDSIGSKTQFGLYISLEYL